MTLKFWKMWKKKKRNGGVQNTDVQANDYQDVSSNHGTIEAGQKAKIFAQRGDELMNTRNYDTASVMYGEALQFSPNDPALYLKRAASFTCLNPARKDLAWRDLEHFAALNGSPTLATSAQADILTRNGLLVSSAAVAAGDHGPEVAGRVGPQTPLPQSPPTAEEARATRLRTASHLNDVVPRTIDVSRETEIPSPSQRPSTQPSLLPQSPPTAEEARATRLRTASPLNDVVPRTNDVSRETEIPSPSQHPPTQPSLSLRGVEQQNLINPRDEASSNPSLGDSRSNGETPLTRILQHETCGESNSPAPLEPSYAAVGDDLCHPISNIAGETRDSDTVDEVPKVPEDKVFTIPQSIINKLTRGNVNISDSFLTDPEPLFYAAAYGHLDILEFIFAHIQQEHPHIKNNNNTVSWHGYPTPLNAALENSRREAANLLMRHGAVFTERSTNRKEQIADLVSYAGDNGELLDRLICMKNEMVNSVPVEEEPFSTNNGAWALYFYFLRNNVRFVRYLWENGVREYVGTREATSVYTSLGHMYVLYHLEDERCRDVNQYLRSSSAKKDLEDMWRRSHRLRRSQLAFPLPLRPGDMPGCHAGLGREESPFIEMDILRWA